MFPPSAHCDCHKSTAKPTRPRRSREKRVARSERRSREKRATKSREHPKRNIKTSFILRLLCSNICEFALLLLLNQLEFPHDRSPVCFWCCYAIRRLGYIASVFCVSLPGKHISLVICVRGHTYHGETHITVTPARPPLKWSAATHQESNMAAVCVKILRPSLCALRFCGSTSAGKWSKKCNLIIQCYWILINLTFLALYYTDSPKDKSRFQNLPSGLNLSLKPTANVLSSSKVYIRLATTGDSCKYDFLKWCFPNVV